jgi:hypothetical protein
MTLSRRKVDVLGGDHVHAGGVGGGISGKGQAFSVRQTVDLDRYHEAFS